MMVTPLHRAIAPIHILTTISGYIDENMIVKNPAIIMRILLIASFLVQSHTARISTIILIFCKDNSRNYIDHKSKKTNDSHSLTVRYPPDGILVDNPKKDDNTSDNHNPPFYLSEKCFYSIGFIQSIYTTKIICPIKNKV